VITTPNGPVRLQGESGVAAWLVPVTVDGLILAAPRGGPDQRSDACAAPLPDPQWAVAIPGMGVDVIEMRIPGQLTPKRPGTSQAASDVVGRQDGVLDGRTAVIWPPAT
jgi:hypothetical protein